MPSVTPGDWLPLVVIRVITNLSYTMQRYKKYLKPPNILATFFDIFIIPFAKNKVHEKALTFRVLLMSAFLLYYFLYSLKVRK